MAFDAEWCWWAQKGAADVLQLAFPSGHVYVVHVRFVKLPKDVKAMLRNPALPKLGFATKNDLAQLKLRGLHMNNVQDLQRRCQAVLKEENQPGLARVAEKFLGITLEKSKAMTFSDWSRELSDQQVMYAAQDLVERFDTEPFPDFSAK